MDFTRGRLFLCTAFKSIITSLFLFWRSRSTFPMQTPKYKPTSTPQNRKLGLKTLIFNHDHRRIAHRKYKLASSSPSPQSSLTSSMSLLGKKSSWTSSMMDDLLGTDSGVPFMATSEEDLFTSMTTSTSCSIPKKKSTPVKREFPPPIPILAQTGNLQCRMPWNLTRHYFNGRLVLQEEKAEHHEYFEAERDNGRLVLKLVPLDNTIVTSHDVPPEFESYSGGHLVVCEENDEELEMEVQFAEEDYAENDSDDDDDDADVDEGDDDECDNNVDESKAMLVCNSVPQSHSEISRCAEKYGYLSAAIHEQQQNYFAHPASAPLRSITTAVI